MTSTRAQVQRVTITDAKRTGPNTLELHMDREGEHLVYFAWVHPDGPQEEGRALLDNLERHLLRSATDVSRA